MKIAVPLLLSFMEDVDCESFNKGGAVVASWPRLGKVFSRSSSVLLLANQTNEKTRILRVHNEAVKTHFVVNMFVKTQDANKTVSPYLKNCISLGTCCINRR